MKQNADEEITQPADPSVTASLSGRWTADVERYHSEHLLLATSERPTRDIRSAAARAGSRLDRSGRITVVIELPGEAA